MIKRYLIKNIITNKINNICNKYIRIILNSESMTLNYKGFPKSICISINEEICHGIPKNKIIKIFDLINIDITIKHNNYCSDTNKMFNINNINRNLIKLIKINELSLLNSIKKIKIKDNINLIGILIEKKSKKYKFNIIKEYCGHGIGKYLHENPYILHYKNNENKIKIKKNMVFTIEPILTRKNEKINYFKNKIITNNNMFSSQYEHTILIKKNKNKILTLRNENIKR